MTMTRPVLATLALIVLGLSAAPLVAQETAIDRWRADPWTVFEADEVTRAETAYLARTLLVFADSPNQPQFARQLALIAEGAEDLAVRDVMVIVDTDPAGAGEWRTALRPRGFSLVLIDKDGVVVFRKPDPWDAREISRQIDKLPSRLQEVRG